MIARVSTFAAVGVGVTGLSFAVLTVLVELLGWTPHLAYAVQAGVSIEANFLLNRRFTWHDRRHSRTTWNQWVRFHSSRAATVPLNQASFSALTLAGVPYWAANAVCIGGTAAVNFLTAHLWVFRRVDHAEVR
jgi:putative flippase GtrA